MKTNTSNRFLKWAVVLLLAVNTVVLFFHVRLLMADDKRPHPDRLKDRMIHDLNLDEAQQQAYGDMVERHRAAMRDIRRQEEETRTRLYTNPGDSTLDRTAHLRHLGLLREQRERVTFDHFMELRGILRTDQQPAFDEIIGEAVNGMEPRPPKK